jgi:hypothetical protein
MKYVVRKAFWDYEKEEKWLNEMSAKGMALTDYSWCRYVFEEEPHNQYTYRIELLENMHNHPESVAYIRFLEESGVECVAAHMRWIFLRKKTSEGSFEIYTDIDSKINHYKRIYTLWNTLMIVEFTAGLSNLIIGIVNLNIGEKLGNFSHGNIAIGLCLVPLGLLFFRLGRPIGKKIKKLEQEKNIRE